MAESLIVSGGKSKTYAGAIVGDKDLLLGGALPRWIHVGTAGNLALVYADGTADIIKCAAGALLPIQPRTITAATTTAQDVTAIY